MAKDTAKRRAPRTDRAGVEAIEALPKSFTFKERDRADADRREANAILDALATRVGKDAMVKRFQKPESAAAFSDYLRAQHAASHEDTTIDVHVSGCEVYAKLDTIAQLVEGEV